MKVKITLFILFALSFTTCRQSGLGDDENLITATQVCLAIKHHAETVEDTEVYLKFNPEGFPGYSGFAYDTLLANDPNSGYICINDIAFGTYWFMSKGFDRNWGASGDDVQGALFLELTQFDPVIDTVLVVNEF